MKKTLTMLAAVILGMVAIFALIWFGTSPNDPVTVEPAKGSATFNAIAPEEEFVEKWARPLLALLTDNGFPAQSQPADGDRTTSLTEQSRILYILAIAQDISGDPAFAEAIGNGTRTLLDAFHDPDGNRWYQHAATDGVHNDTTADSLALAHTIMGLAHAYRITLDENLREAALATWRESSEIMLAIPRLADTGDLDVFEGLTPPARPEALMYLMEALLALHEATGEDEVWQDVEVIAKFVVKDLLANSNGYLAEDYTPDFQPVAGGRVHVDHQFTWGYLISRTIERGLSPLFLDPALGLVERTLATAADMDSGGMAGTINMANGTADVTSKPASAQTEAMRALSHYAVLRRANGFWPAFERIHSEAANQPATYDIAAAFHHARLYAEIARLQSLAP